MSKIYEKLYEAAKLNSKAVDVLKRNNVFSPAIYHCAQAVEKASKSIHAYYMINFENKSETETSNVLRRNYGHGLRKSTKGIIDSLMNAYINHHVKINPKLKGTESQAHKSLQNAGETIVQDVLDMDEIILGFNILADRMYYIYQNFNSIISQEPTFGPIDESLKKEITGPDKKYYWYIFLVMLLSSFLDKLEKYSRYPMLELSNNNITLLNGAHNKFAIERISKMITELIILVPVVWKQIDLFKNSLRKSP